MSSKREKKKWLSVTQRFLSAEESGGTQQFTLGFFWLHKKKGIPSTHSKMAPKIFIYSSTVEVAVMLPLF